MKKINLKKEEKLLMWGEITQTTNQVGQRIARQYAVNELDDASTVVKLLEEGSTKTETQITFTDGEMKMEDSQFNFFKKVFNEKKKWSIPEKELKDSIEEKIKESENEKSTK